MFKKSKYYYENLHFTEQISIMEIGTLLRKLRDSRRLTTRKVAETTGVAHATYLDWEHDKSSPSLRFYLKLAAAFDACPVEMMAYLTGKIPEPKSSEQKVLQSYLNEIMSLHERYSDSIKDQETPEVASAVSLGN